VVLLCRALQGLAALSYFAADGRYAAGGKPESADEEFDQLVRGLHARGLEVLMQVCSCHVSLGILSELLCHVSHRVCACSAMQQHW
jgi:hypothetical protein